MFGMSDVESSYAIAVLIGIVVSLDVGGLLISQHKEFKNSSLTNAGTIVAHAQLHAFVHSTLFLLYVAFVQLLLLVATWFPDWLIRTLSEAFRAIFFLPPIDAAEALKTGVLLSSLVVIVLVWLTYSVKIVENHQEKLIPGDPLVGSRFDIKAIYYLLRSRTRGNAGRIRLAMALAVAIDMLAISSIIRVYFRGAIDAGQRAGPEIDAKLTHFNFGIGTNLSELLDNLLQPLIFGLIIFVVVFVCALIAIIISRSLSDERQVPVLVVLRIVEPFLVFWILVASVDHLFGFPPEDPFHIVAKIFVGVPISLALTSLMVWMRGLGTVRAAVEAGANVTTEELEDLREKEAVDWAHFRKMAGRILAIGAFFSLVFIVLFYFAHLPDVAGQPLPPGSGFSRFMELLSIGLNIIVLVLLYVPWQRLLNLEFELNRFFFRGMTETDFVTFLYPVAAYFLVLLYIHVSYVRTDLFSIHEGEHFIVPLAYLGIIVSIAWALALTRHARLLGLARAKGVDVGDALSIGDGLNSVAIVLFAFQTVLWLAQKLPGFFG